MRGSDPDAAVYWMMRMLEAGDDPLFVSRRMLIFASEDVGNADPRALDRRDRGRRGRSAAWGCPRASTRSRRRASTWRRAPKSNACDVAWQRAKELIDEHGALAVPMKLRNAVTQLMKEEGYGEGYKYAHDYEGGVVPGETYLPDELEATRSLRADRPRRRGAHPRAARRDTRKAREVDAHRLAGHPCRGLGRSAHPSAPSAASSSLAACASPFLPAASTPDGKPHSLRRRCGPSAPASDRTSDTSVRSPACAPATPRRPRAPLRGATKLGTPWRGRTRRTGLLLSDPPGAVCFKRNSSLLLVRLIPSRPSMRPPWGMIQL